MNSMTSSSAKRHAIRKEIGIGIGKKNAERIWFGFGKWETEVYLNILIETEVYSLLTGDDLTRLFVLNRCRPGNRNV